VVMKMEKPRAQVSVYQDNDGKASQRPAGVQEPAHVVQPKKPVAKPVNPATPETSTNAPGTTPSNPQ
jgi:hypothetical protein